MQQQPDNRRIAVLPLANMSQDARDEIFSDGMTEELISSLSKIAGLRVIARTSVMRYKDTKKPIGEISKELNVSAILEGSVRRAGNKILCFHPTILTVRGRSGRLPGTFRYALPPF